MLLFNALLPFVQPEIKPHKKPFFLNFKMHKKSLKDKIFKAFCDPAGTRTQGPYIKSVLLYQLSYRIIAFFKAAANIYIHSFIPTFIFNNLKVILSFAFLFF